jgi:hypothetical protein
MADGRAAHRYRSSIPVNLTAEVVLAWRAESSAFD